jgi:plasmid stabilization system protein ParE
MTSVWSPEAINDLAALRAYIEQDNPAAAQRVVLRIIENGSRPISYRLRSSLLLPC